MKRVSSTITCSGIESGVRAGDMISVFGAPAMVVLAVAGSTLTVRPAKWIDVVAGFVRGAASWASRLAAKMFVSLWKLASGQ